MSTLFTNLELARLQLSKNGDGWNRELEQLKQSRSGTVPSDYHILFDRVPPNKCSIVRAKEIQFGLESDIMEHADFILKDENGNLKIVTESELQEVLKESAVDLESELQTASYLDLSRRNRESQKKICKLARL